MVYNFFLIYFLLKLENPLKITFISAQKTCVTGKERLCVDGTTCEMGTCRANGKYLSRWSTYKIFSTIMFSLFLAGDSCANAGDNCVSTATCEDGTTCKSMGNLFNWLVVFVLLFDLFDLSVGECCPSGGDCVMDSTCLDGICIIDGK